MVSFLLSLVLAVSSIGESTERETQELSSKSTIRHQITVKPSMVINELAKGDAMQLFDEPATFQSGKTPQTLWRPSWKKYDYPISVVVDFGENSQLEKIHIYDGKGSGKIDINYGIPFQWKAFEKLETTAYNKWINLDFPHQTRFIQIVIYSATSTPEITFEGTIGQFEAVDSREKTAEPRFEDFMGVNALINDPVDKIAAVGWLREYHNWAWDEGDRKAYRGYPNNENAFSPSWTGYWDFDHFYKQLRAIDVQVVPCIQRNAYWLVDGDASRMEEKPVYSGADTSDPLSYKAHADHLFQYAARYGSTPVPKSQLKLKSNQKALSGLGYIEYIENWNEPDKWWKGKDAEFSPYEYAAMSSADYDGHQGALGAGHGAKTADPNIKMVMSGITKLSEDYLKAIQFWCDHHRDGSLPFEVINFHHYSNDVGGQGKSTTGVSPEEDQLDQKVADLVDFRNKYFPETEIWISEFGYDTNPESVQRAPRIGSQSTELVQAQWILRSYLLMATSGADKVFQYMLRDVNADNTNKYYSSGFTSSKESGHKAKTSWYFTYTMKNALKGFRFVRKVKSTSPDVYVLQFENESGSMAYAMWSGTSSDKTISNFSFELPSSYQDLSLVTPIDKSITGAVSKPTAKAGSVQIELNETPKFLIIR